ncbi:MULTISPECIES: metallophosphoesterase [Bacillus cereus group]|uniref:Phosphoesterase n=1 Tax=Bacillus thuringiensis TaxID=1428 RepID=A0A9X6WGI3_BACTU|nr:MULTISPECIES: metallophosphoesterase [Bacillus cereus group]PFJ28956.1 phosphoesterase [Bacillus thuringiensis]PGP14558.1 phosphoesterase [Bacillus cereus]
MKKKTKKKLSYFLLGLILLICFCYFQNNYIVTTEYNYSSKKVPESFDGYKIVQLSDLHGKSFGENQKYLMNKITKVKPNLIVFTGDLIDAHKYNEKNSLLLMEKLVQIAPVYYVTGNHEWRSGKFNSLETSLKDIGVHVMRDTYAEIRNGNHKMYLLGIDDPSHRGESYSEQSITEERIKHLNDEIKDEENVKILLSHRPELLSLYSRYNIDLEFAGHAHGGQFRIPFIGGLVAPNQGLLPKYTSGMYVENNTTMIVNRGLGNSIIPVRIFNQPEIVVLTLKNEKN